MKKVILFVGGDFTVGGVGGYINTLCNALGQDNYEFHMTASSTLNDSAAPDYRNLQSHMFPIRYSVGAIPRRALQLRRLIKKLDVDILHLHTARAGFIGAVASAGLDVAVVYTGHSWRHEQKDSALQRKLFFYYEKFICRRAHLVTFISGRDEIIGKAKGLLPGEKCLTIPTRICTQGFDRLSSDARCESRRKLGIPDHAILIGNVGRLEERKDPLTFVKIGARLLPDFRDLHLLWVGDGELRNEILNLASQLGLRDKLIVTGFVPAAEIPNMLGLLDVFLFTSHIEGVPLSILEAQAMERPVVSSAYLGVEELIEDQRTGWLFSPGNVQSGADRVSYVLRNPNEVKNIISAAKKQFLEKHSAPERLAQDYITAYEIALARAHLKV